MKKKMMLMVIGVVLILIALILGGIQLFNAYDFTTAWGWRHLYVYGLFGIIGLIGIIIAAWSLMIVEGPAKGTEPSQPAK